MAIWVPIGNICYSSALETKTTNRHDGLLNYIRELLMQMKFVNFNTQSNPHVFYYYYYKIIVCVIINTYLKNFVYKINENNLLLYMYKLVIYMLLFQCF